MRAAPQTYLCDALVFNLCTLYDLSSDNRASAPGLVGVADRVLLGLLPSRVWRYRPQ